MKKILNQMKPVLGVAVKILILIGIVFALIQAGKNVPESYDFKKTLVKVSGKYGYGSGNVVQSTEKESVILTNKHVCEGTNVNPAIDEAIRFIKYFTKLYPQCSTFDCMNKANPMFGQFWLGILMKLALSDSGFEVPSGNLAENLLILQMLTEKDKKLPLRIEFNNLPKSPVEGKILKASEHADLCLVKIPVGNLPIVRIANKKPKVGDRVITIGNPMGSTNVMVDGYAGDEEVIYGNHYQGITAPIYGGQSGSGTFNMKGELVGVNTLSYIQVASIGYMAVLEDVKLFLSENLERVINMQI